MTTGATPDPTQIANYLAQGEAVSISDAGKSGIRNRQLPVDNGHDYACRDYDPNNNCFLPQIRGTANATSVASTISGQPD